MQYLVTGGAGFIGSHLVDRLLHEGHRVRVLDNFSTGYRRNLERAESKAGFELRELDLFRDEDAVRASFAGVDRVVHLSANADVRLGTERPRRDLEQNTIVTWNVLEAMRAHGVREISFSSTGSVYGEPKDFPTPENAPFPEQTSLYGASKLAGEGLISAYAHGFGFKANVFRFVSCLGPRYSHGHVIDFVRQLRAHPEYLEVLGDGLQNKSYMHVDDCVAGMLKVFDRPGMGFEVYNLGTDDSCEVRQSIAWICDELKLRPELRFAGGRRGWTGDSPRIQLDLRKIAALGHVPRRTIEESVRDTVRFFGGNEWILA